MTTTLRLVLAFILVVGIGFWPLVSAMLDRVDRQYREAAEEPMVDTANLLAAAWAQRPRGQEREFLRRVFDEVKQRQVNALIYSLEKAAVTMDVYVTDAAGVVVYDSTGMQEGQDLRGMKDVALTLAGKYGARATRRVSEDPETSTMYVAAPILRDGKIDGVLSVSKPQQAFYHFRNESRAHMRGLALIFAGVTATGTVLVALWFTRPIRRLTNYARAVSRGERPGPVRMSSPEARGLRDALEQMRDALEDRAYVRSCVQTLTHEMKSPLAGIRGASELLDDPAMPAADRLRFLGNIRSETERLQRSIDRMLALSAVEAKKHLDARRPVDLGALVRRCAGELGAAASGRGVRLEVAAGTDAQVDGDEFLLETSVVNLLENALSFSPAGGTVRVRVVRSGEKITLTVQDEGCGIPEYAQERVFERFYSLPHPDTGRKSSGLGLCFVKEAAELHGGSVSLRNRSDGPGAEAVLVLPGASGAGAGTDTAEPRR